MAEAEDVLQDAARHATIYVQDFWRRHRTGPTAPGTTALRDVARRLDILIGAATGCRFPLGIAQPPARPTMLAKLLRRQDRPWSTEPLPATDGKKIWLPGIVTSCAEVSALDRLRVWSMQQAVRAVRGSAGPLPLIDDPLVRDLYLLIEAQAADEALGKALPGLKPALECVRRATCALRPALHQFPSHRRPVEALVVSVLQRPSNDPPATFPRATDPAAALTAATDLARRLRAELPEAHLCSSWIYRDCWIGELRMPDGGASGGIRNEDVAEPSRDEDGPIHSSRLDRRPGIRDAEDDEDDSEPGAWMVQPAAPLEQAEDPMGLQRPADQDEETAAESFADSLAELPETRLVSSPGRPKEVLLSDDPPPPRTRKAVSPSPDPSQSFTYPEWNYRAGAYKEPGATVRLVPLKPGPRQWVEDTLLAQRPIIATIRRRFEVLKAQPVTLHRQLDGDDVDLDAHVEALADFRAGVPLSQALYQQRVPARRSLAMLLLIDASGSTDGWIADQRRIVDVEREALLLVCTALDGVAEEFSVLAFSGNGPGNVRLSIVKGFMDPYDDLVACRIAGLEPDEYTRAGAAIRHATADLMTRKVEHRLLLLLSDGKPNDVDQYDGRYGFEDVRQALNEARQQGVSPFCLTIDRQAAAYLPQLFGTGHYALLPRPELLPSVLIDWVRRLMST